MPKKNQLEPISDQEDLEVLQHKVSILSAQNEHMNLLLALQNRTSEDKTDKHYKFCSLLSKKLNLSLQEALKLEQGERTDSSMSFINYSKGKAYYISLDDFGAILDETFEKEGHLIRLSDIIIARYSPFRVDPELQDYVLHEGKRNLFDLLKDISGHTLSFQQQFFDRAEQVIQESTPYNTRLAYQSDIVYWIAWCRAKGKSLNNQISIDEVCAFIIDHSEGMSIAVDEHLVSVGYKKTLGPHKLATVKRRLASLSVFYDAHAWTNPTRDRKVNQLLKCLTKKYGGSKPAGRAITLDILNLMLDTCKKDKIHDIRDKALLLFGWSSGGRRRSEIAAANVKDLQEDPDGNYVYTMPTSKTDQLKEGTVLPINGRAAAALKEWIIQANITEGALFRSIAKGGKVNAKALWGDDINRIVKKRLKMAGLDPSLFGAHGLRSGFVTEAGRRNKPTGDVMALTTHKSHTTFMKYYRPGNIKHNSAANLADE